MNESTALKVLSGQLFDIATALSEKEFSNLLDKLTSYIIPTAIDINAEFTNRGAAK